MQHISVRLVAFLALPMSLGGGTALAQSVPHIDSTWAKVAEAEDGYCSGEVTGNGKFYKIAARGLDETSAANLYLTNEDMVPIDRQAIVGVGGTYSEYYIPFLWGHETGTVNVTLTGSDCVLNFSFAWDSRHATLR